MLTVTGSPLNGATDALRNAFAMQPPVAVPANGGPFTLAMVTLPLGAKVTETWALPLGSPSFLHAAA